MLVFGPAVVASAFLLVWAAEAAQRDISGSLATAILAVIAVLPEYDGVVLLAVFAIYLWRAAHGERREPELIGVARQLGELPRMPRRIAVSALFIAAGAIVLMAAEPFAVALVAGGKQFGFDEF